MRVKATLSSHALVVDGDAQNGWRLLMVKLAYGDHRHKKWALPGGFVDAGESLEQALVREVNEEIGITLTRFRQIQSVAFLSKSNPHPHIGFLYLADAWEGQPRTISHELLDLAWVDEREFHRFVDEERLAYPDMVEQVIPLGWRVKKETA